MLKVEKWGGRSLAILVILVSVLTSACTTMEVDEKNFIRPDQRSGWVKKKDLSKAKLEQAFPELAIEEVKLQSNDGNVLHGIFAQVEPTSLETVQPEQTTVLYFGGNMFHLDDASDAVLSVPRSCKANWISYDYRGYGRSAGDPTIALMQQDALAIYDAVRARVKGRLVLHGHSLGSFIASYVAGQRAVDGVILESTATNALDWANANVPWYVKPFVRIQINPSLQGIDNVLEMGKHRGAGLVLVGDRDEVTPAYLGERVAAAMANPNKRFLVITGAGHNGLLQGEIGRPAREAYCAFLRAQP